MKKNVSKIQKIAMIGVLSALATVVMLLEIPLWFAPDFYKIDLSEIIVLIGSFALGPISGVMIELVKVLLNLVLNGTITGGVGEAANFVIGCSLVVPASVIYKRNKTRKNALIGLVIGVTSMTVVGSALNGLVLLPVYAVVFGMPIQKLIEMGTAVNPAITNMPTFLLFAVAPFNLLKGTIVGILTLLLYKRVSPVLRPWEWQKTICSKK